MKLCSAVALVSVALVGCSVCENEIISTSPSPTGQHNAVVFHRNCGATTGFNTQLSIVPSNKQLSNGGGNAAIADGQNSLSVEWRTPRSLLVTTHGGPRTYKTTSSVGNIAVEYRSVP